MSFVSTYRGETISVEDMSHQHVSNWIHYSRWVYENEDTERYFKVVLDYFHGGELLDYKPNSDFELEMEVLHEKNMITDNLMVINPNTGERIGEVQV